MGAKVEAGLQSFRVLLTHLTYVPVGNIDIETCPKCGGAVKIIACIEDPEVINKILTHLDKRTPLDEPVALPQPRAPPQAGLFD